MPTAAMAYKTGPITHTEVLDIDEGLWDQIRLATSFIERQGTRSAPQGSPASAVVVRRPGGEPVVVVLVDRKAQTFTPDASDLCRRYNLTPRETEVALLLAQRMSCREIANRLEITFHTARCYTERIMQKLGVRSKNDVRDRLGAAK